MTNYRHGAMIDLIGTMASPKLRVHRDRCVLVRNRNAECLHCAEVCTSGAIAFGDEGLAVTPEKCIGCGTCASACPSGCLEAAAPTDEELFGAMAAALQRSSSVAFACGTVLGEEEPGQVIGSLPGGGCIIAVTCLGRVDESLLVEAVVRGAQKIQLIGGDCEHCAHRSGGELCDKIMASAEHLLEALDIASPFERLSVDEIYYAPFPVRPTAALGGEEPAVSGTDVQEDSVDGPASSRPVRSWAADPAARTALKPGHGIDFTPKYVHVQSDGTLPHFVPERRLRLFNSLKALGAPQVDTVETRLWGQVDLDTELCRSCRMCTVFCPTGALARFDAPGGAFGVEHRSALCMQCRLCETICPEQAITVRSEVDFNEFLTGKKFRFAMLPVGWNPGAEDAIATRMARFVKTDTMQEPQAKVGVNDVVERRAYAQERERRRREIRAAAGEESMAESR